MIRTSDFFVQDITAVGTVESTVQQSSIHDRPQVNSSVKTYAL
ncbi:unnamed protein product, partial [Musa acuminata subsp. burmannicoides]